METSEKIEKQIQDKLKHTIITDRRFLDDEQLDRKEQFEVLKEIFDIDVRDREIRELSLHFAPIFNHGHPIHLSVLGKTGIGKTVSILYFLNTLQDLSRKDKIPFRYVHLDLSIPKPCFRALNDLACYLDAAKRYKRGVSLDELMSRIEEKLQSYEGYFLVFVDEVDHIRRDLDSFLKFLVKRLPQAVPLKLVLIFSSNNLNWQENIDPRITSFLKLSEVLFDPYNACDLKKILRLRMEKAMKTDMIQEGVIEKIAAVCSRNHGDARKAVELLYKSGQLAEKRLSPVSLDIVDQALDAVEKDKYVAMIKTAPRQLQAALLAILTKAQATLPITDCYESYSRFCTKTRMRVLTQRAFSDLISELDMYGFIRVRMVSNGRYGRRREITQNTSDELTQRLVQVILMEFDLE
ncbi:MAG: AAA family ATPase [Desulfovermiculus sp.]|nr:AAA family ATPase [Desulfovermiculus sp.]